MVNKRGQITIFVILGLMIVVIGVLVFLFYPTIKSAIGFDSKNPSQFIESCVEDKIKESLSIIALQGGSINPENYILYNGEKIEYLCYTQNYYETCVMQQPMLKKHIEGEIKENIQEDMDFCFDELKESYERKGYDVVLTKNDFNVELLPNKVVVTSNNSMNIKKEESEQYNSVSLVINDNIYELISIANSILNWEAHYGDAETTTYMNYYHDLKVEKKKQTDGSTIYILTNRDGSGMFQFASRSVAWPPGYIGGEQ